MPSPPPSAPPASHPPSSPPIAERRDPAADPAPLAAALRRVDRRRFTADEGHGLIAGRSIPTRDAVARLVHAAEVGAPDRVLHVGGGAGYVGAALAELAGEVVVVERVPGLAQIARARLEASARAPVQVLEGDGLDAEAITAQAGRFDVVLVTCRAALGAGDAAGQRARPRDGGHDPAGRAAAAAAGRADGARAGRAAAVSARAGVRSRPRPAISWP